MTLGKCASLSSLVGAVIDGTDLFVNGYTLEISSPGLDRPLSKVVDYKYRIGETVKLNFAKRSRPAVRAKIVSVSDSKIVFENENGSFTEELTNIEKAKIVY